MGSPHKVQLHLLRQRTAGCCKARSHFISQSKKTTNNLRLPCNTNSDTRRRFWKSEAQQLCQSYTKHFSPDTPLLNRPKMTKGSCLCAALTYTYNASSPVRTAICHCIPCRKTAGPRGSTNLILPAADFHPKATEGIFNYTRKGDSGKAVTYCSCKGCGTIVWVEVGCRPSYTCSWFADSGFENASFWG